ncbi:MAG: ABC transporter ATP-binding protein [Candidatus Heimdallarchaeota archaeon]
METEILALRSVSFGYPKVSIFDDLSVSFQRGELVALLGANGTGKTTLLRLLNGLLRPQKGVILLHGKPLPKKVSVAARSVGIAFQNPVHQFFAASVREELEYAQRWLKNKKQRVSETAEAIAKQFNLEELLERSPYSLSSGEQRRLSIATIIALGAHLIGLDEPTVGQDLRGRKNLANLLIKMKQSGLGIIAATHDVEWIAPIADRVLVLERDNPPIQGLVSEILTSSTILQNANLHVPQLVDLGNVLQLGTLNGDWDSLSERNAHALSSRLAKISPKGDC